MTRLSTFFWLGPRVVSCDPAHAEPRHLYRPMVPPALPEAASAWPASTPAASTRAASPQLVVTVTVTVTAALFATASPVQLQPRPCLRLRAQEGACFPAPPRPRPLAPPLSQRVEEQIGIIFADFSPIRGRAGIQEHLDRREASSGEKPSTGPSPGRPGDRKHVTLSGPRVPSAAARDLYWASPQAGGRDGARRRRVPAALAAPVWAAPVSTAAARDRGGAAHKVPGRDARRPRHR